MHSGFYYGSSTPKAKSVEARVIKMISGDDDDKFTNRRVTTASTWRKHIHGALSLIECLDQPSKVEKLDPLTQSPLTLYF